MYQVIIAGGSTDTVGEQRRRISEVWLGMSTAAALTSRLSDKERISEAIKAVTNYEELDLQIITALCNTEYFSNNLGSAPIPPWERTEMGGTREAMFRDRLQAFEDSFFESKIESLVEPGYEQRGSGCVMLNEMHGPTVSCWDSLIRFKMPGIKCFIVALH